MDSCMKVQAQIRQNAEEVSTYLTDLKKWEKSIKKKDKAIRGPRGPRGSTGTVVVNSAGPTSMSKVVADPATSTSEASKKGSTVLVEADGSAQSAARHTYDKGYKKWEDFDVDAALNAADDEDSALKRKDAPQTDDVEVSESKEDTSEANRFLTPASMVKKYVTAPKVSAPVPKARGTISTADAETYERERGNEEFKKGNFPGAVKCYTKCLGMKAANYIAFSNRAMAYLKLKEYNRAEVDCTCALSIEPSHVKSLMRRSTARNALGRHRAALRDLLEALEIDPASKQTKGEIQRTQEMLRSAVNRAPMVRVAPVGLGDLALTSGDGNGDVLASSDSSSQKPSTEKSTKNYIIESLAGPELPPPPGTELPDTSTDESKLHDSQESDASEETKDGDSAAKDDYVTKDASRDGDNDDADDDDDDDVIEVPIKSSSGMVKEHVDANTTTNSEKTEKTAAMDACAYSDRSKRGGEDKVKSGATKTSANKASTGKKVAKKSKDSGKASKGLSAGSNSVDTSYGLERRLLSVRGNITAQVALVESLKISEVNKLLGGLPEPEMVAELLLTVGAAAEKQCESISDSEVETKWTHVINWYRAVSKSSAFGLVKNLFSAEQADSLRATLRKACDIVSAGGASSAGVSAEQCKEVQGIYATV